MTSAASMTISGLSHRYSRGDRPALEDVSFQVAPGDRVGLLGPNGAGKSTLMRIVCGYLTADSQAKMVEVAGFDVRTHSLSVRERVGYLPEHVPLYPELRVREHLGFRAAIKRIPRSRRLTEIASVAERTGLVDKLGVPIGQLSRGYRQRVGIADALLGTPPLVVLDEPTVGLDPNQVQEIRAMLRELGGNQTLVFSSHILAEVEMLCDRVVILAQGRVVADEPLDNALRAGYVHVQWRASIELVTPLIASLERQFETRLNISLHEIEDSACGRIEVPNEWRGRVEDVLDKIGEASLEHQVVIQRLEPGRTRLEERFSEVTGAGRGA